MTAEYRNPLGEFHAPVLRLRPLIISAANSLYSQASGLPSFDIQSLKLVHESIFASPVCFIKRPKKLTKLTCRYLRYFQRADEKAREVLFCQLRSLLLQAFLIVLRTKDNGFNDTEYLTKYSSVYTALQHLHDVKGGQVRYFDQFFSEDEKEICQSLLNCIDVTSAPKREHLEATIKRVLALVPFFLKKSIIYSFINSESTLDDDKELAFSVNLYHHFKKLKKSQSFRLEAGKFDASSSDDLVSLCLKKEEQLLMQSMAIDHGLGSYSGGPSVLSFA